LIRYWTKAIYWLKASECGGFMSLFTRLQKDVEKLSKAYEVRDQEIWMKIDKKDLKDFLKSLKEKYDVHFITITASDVGTKIQLIYHLDVNGILLNVETLIGKLSAFMDSVSDVFRGAEWIEGEISEMFNVKFKGKKYPRRFLSKKFSEGFHPLRRGKL